MKTMIIGVMDSNIGGLNHYIVDYVKLNSQIYNFIILAFGDIHQNYKEELPDNVKIHQICSITHPLKLYKISCKIFNEIKAYCVYLNVSTNLFFPVIKAAKENKIEQIKIHSHSSWSAEANFIKRIIIITINIILRRRVVKNATDLLACSDKAANWLYGKNTPFIFINNKVNEKLFSFDANKRSNIRKELRLENKLCIGFIGSFSPPKKIFYFINLAQRLSCVNKNFVILMLGQGLFFDKFKTLIQKYNLSSYFILTGNKKNAADYYNAFDCFVLPSRFEGLPIVGVEAQVNGLPCYFSTNITKQIQITRNCHFFNNHKYDLIKDLTVLTVKNHGEKYQLDNYKDFVY